MSPIFSKIRSWFQRTKPPFVNNQTTVSEFLSFYPHARALLEQKYAIRLGLNDQNLSMMEFCTLHKLPVPQILFMEVQIAGNRSQIRSLSAKNTSQFIASNTGSVTILDVREPWERKLGQIKGAKPLTEEEFENAKVHWPKDTPIVLYCHFGIRSLDAAHEFVSQGFTEVYTIAGGIDAWSQEVDPSVARYEGSWC